MLSRPLGRFNVLKFWDNKSGISFPGKRKYFFLPGLQIKLMSTFYFNSRNVAEQDSLKGKIPISMAAISKKNIKIKNL